eukprot:gene9680-9838_t
MASGLKGDAPATAQINIPQNLATLPSGISSDLSQRGKINFSGSAITDAAIAEQLMDPLVIAQKMASFGAQMHAFVPALTDMADGSLHLVPEQISQLLNGLQVSYPSDPEVAGTIGELDNSYALPEQLSSNAHSTAGAVPTNYSYKQSSSNVPSDHIASGHATTPDQASSVMDSHAASATGGEGIKATGFAASLHERGSSGSSTWTTIGSSGRASAAMTVGSGGRRLQSAETLAGPLAGLGRNGRRMQAVSDDGKVL